jgi:lipopolysaccharide export system permease protein
MALIDRYVAGNFFGAFLAVLVLLLALFSFVSLVEEMESVGQGSFTGGDAIDVVALTMPKRAVDLMPVTALLGAIIGLGGMAANREILVLRAIGWSPLRIARGVLVVVGLLMLTGFGLQQFAMAPLERRAADIRALAVADTAVSSARGEFWTRSGNHIVRVGNARWGRTPQDIEIYDIDPQGRVAKVTQADSADVLENDRWLLHDVHESLIEAERVEDRHLDSMEWQSFLSPRQLSAFVMPAETLSSGALYRYIEQLESSGLSTQRYRIIFWRQMSMPVALLGMALLGLPFIMGSVRRIAAGYRIAAGAAIGIVFYLLNQIAGHLALIYDVGPAPAAFGPSALVLLAAIAWLWRLSPTPSGGKWTI